MSKSLQMRENRPLHLARLAGRSLAFLQICEPGTWEPSYAWLLSCSQSRTPEVQLFLLFSPDHVVTWVLPSHQALGQNPSIRGGEPLCSPRAALSLSKVMGQHHLSDQCRRDACSLAPEGISLASPWCLASWSFKIQKKPCLFKKKLGIFFWCGPLFKSLYLICYNTASFMFWFFLSQGMRDLSSSTRDQICIPCIGRWSLNVWTAREVLRPCSKVLKNIIFQQTHILMKLCIYV